jgi:alkylhydroperoxidase family enzyme
VEQEDERDESREGTPLHSWSRESARPWIGIVPLSEATGLLKQLFDAALARADRVWNIVHVMSPNPSVMEASMAFYRALMFGPSPLSRAQREMLAVVTSREIRCVY